MATLNNFQIQDYELLLGSENVDIADAAAQAHEGTMQPNTRNRTVLIGMGGTGVKALNKIKSVLRARMAPGWNRYVAFLAIDTDGHELSRATELAPVEVLNTTKAGVNKRYEARSSYPPVAHQFMPDGYPNPNEAPKLDDMYADGSNQQRLVGKIKIHDKEGGSAMGNDEEIVHRLTMLTSSSYMNPMTVSNGRYEVYVIGSGSGGTCSGAFLEMPALIQHALKVVADGKLNIHGLLFLPDSVEGLDPANQQRLRANGYATLKELNYYQGMVMRPGYTELFPYGGTPAQLEVQKFYDMPYLVGTTASGSGKNACRSAREAIAEFVLSLLAEISTTNSQQAPFLTDSFLSNIGPTKWSRDEDVQSRTAKERPDFYHNIPRGYAAIGFARATAQEKLLRTYQVNIACERAALHTVSKEAREAAEHNPKSLPAFRAADDYFNAAEAENIIEDMMSPLANLLNEVYCGVFNLSQAAGDSLTSYEDAREFTDENIRGFSDAAIKAQTATDASEALKGVIQVAYNAYRSKVIAFVKNHGPLAFVNLFHGNILPNSGGQTVTGIFQRLKYLAEGKLMDGTEYYVKSVAEANQARQKAQNVLSETPPSLKNKAKNLINGFLDNIRGEWETTINDWVVAQIHAKRRELAFGDSGFVTSVLLSGAAIMADKLASFGHLLNAMNSIYARGGKTVQDFNVFQNASESDVDVNMAAMDNKAYEWLKKKAEDAIAAVQGRDIRDRIIDDFFGFDKITGVPNWDAWLEVPESVAKLDGSKMILQSDEVAIPARARFDKLVTEGLTAPLNVSVRELFEQMTAGGSYDTVAAQIIAKLSAASEPRCNINGTFKTHKYVLYPADLRQGANGPAIVQALQTAAGSNVGFYETSDAEGIMFYQQAVDFGVDQIKSIGDWELAYNQHVGKVYQNFLHAKSPCTKLVSENGIYKYKEPMLWRDYPDLVGRANPEQRNQNGDVCREGQQRMKVHETVAEARLLGVLYADKDSEGKYVIYRAHCDRVTDEWKFDIASCGMDASGKLPLGKALAEVVASLNGRTLGDDYNSMSRVVRFEYGGVLSKGHDSEEQAWAYAERVLRDHVPMYREVVETVENYFRVWAKEIIEYNGWIDTRNRPGMMEYLLQTGALYRRDDDQWVVRLEDDSERTVVNLNPTIIQWSTDGAAIMLENNMLGYYLFTKIDALLPGDKLRKTCEAANAYLQKYMQNPAVLEPKLKAGAANVEQILKERQFHISNYCRGNIDASKNDAFSAPSPLYVDFLNGLLGYDVNQATPVELFYRRVLTVEQLRKLFLSMPAAPTGK